MWSSSMAITSSCDRLSLSWPSQDVMSAGTLQEIVNFGFPDLCIMVSTTLCRFRELPASRKIELVLKKLPMVGSLFQVGFIGLSGASQLNSTQSLVTQTCRRHAGGGFIERMYLWV